MSNQASMVSSLKEQADQATEATEIVVWCNRINETLELPLPLKQPRPINPPNWKLGVYPYWSWLSFEISKRLNILTRAWDTLKDEKYFLTAKRDVLDLCRWSSWVEHAKVGPSIFIAQISCEITRFYMSYYNDLEKRERIVIERALHEKGLMPLRERLTKLKSLTGNIELVQLSALGIVSLALEFKAAYDGRDEINFAKRKILEYVKMRHRSVPQSNFVRYIYSFLRRFGGFSKSLSTEGLTYDSFAFDFIVRFGEFLAQIRGDESILRHRFLHDTLVYMPLYFCLPGNEGSLANFDDYEEGDFQRWTSLLSALYAKRPNPAVKWYLDRIQDQLGASLPDIGTPSSSVTLNLPTARHFQNMGWVAMRSGWGEDDVLIAFKATSGGGLHTHYDQNNLIIGCKGEWILSDPGYQEFIGCKEEWETHPRRQFTLTTLGHNNLIINDHRQEVKKGWIERFCSNDKYDYARGNATLCYPSSAHLSKFVRHLIFVKPDILFIYDEIAFRERHNVVESLWHTDANGEIHDAQHGAKFIKANVQGQFNILHPSGFTRSIEFYTGAEDYGPYAKFKFRTNGNEVDLVYALFIGRNGVMPSTECSIKRDRQSIWVRHPTLTLHIVKNPLTRHKNVRIYESNTL